MVSPHGLARLSYYDAPYHYVFQSRRHPTDLPTAVRRRHEPFVAFSEYMNFIIILQLARSIHKRKKDKSRWAFLSKISFLRPLSLCISVAPSSNRFAYRRSTATWALTKAKLFMMSNVTRPPRDHS